MKEIAPCRIESHQTKVAVEVVVEESRFAMSLVVRNQSDNEEIGRLRIDSAQIEPTDLEPETAYVVADSIHRALQVMPESHPHVIDALTWQSDTGWDTALEAVESMRSERRQDSLQPV